LQEGHATFDQPSTWSVAAVVFQDGQSPFEISGSISRKRSFVRGHDFAMIFRFALVSEHLVNGDRVAFSLYCDHIQKAKIESVESALDDAFTRDDGSTVLFVEAFEPRGEVDSSPTR
jgi:hypothetical protein